MISYVDTSLLLKLYIEEPDSYLAFQWLEPKGVQPVISTLSEVEMSSALHRSAPQKGPESGVAWRCLSGISC